MPLARDPPLTQKKAHSRSPSLHTQQSGHNHQYEGPGRGYLGRLMKEHFVHWKWKGTNSTPYDTVISQVILNGRCFELLILPICLSSKEIVTILYSYQLWQFRWLNRFHNWYCVNFKLIKFRLKIIKNVTRLHNVINGSNWICVASCSSRVSSTFSR